MKETPETNLANEQFDEARVRALLDEGRLDDAERMAERAVRALEGGSDRLLLTEALRTRGVALARLGRYEEARASLERAIAVAEEAGDFEHAGRAALTVVEELCEHLAGDELSAAYERAAQLLASSQNPDTLQRLVACARRVVSQVSEHPTQIDWDNFSFREAVLNYESGIIEKALKDAGGVVSRAAQLLGMKHHNNLVSIINTRHRELLRERRPIVPRRRSIITRNKPRRPHESDAEDSNAMVNNAEETDAMVKK
jgi:tetratricopeptide (TPR) repeat protein